MDTRDNDEQEWLPWDREKILRTQLEISTQQETRTHYQPYVDLTMDPDPGTALTLRTPLAADPVQGDAPQEVEREEQWAQDARDLKETDYILRYYADEIGLVVMEMYMGLRHEHMISASLLDAAMVVHLRPRWTGMKTRVLTAHIRHLPHEECTPTSNALNEKVHNTEAMFLIHPTTMHFNGVIALHNPYLV